MLNDKLITMYSMLVGILGQREEWRHYNYVCECLFIDQHEEILSSSVLLKQQVETSLFSFYSVIEASSSIVLGWWRGDRAFIWSSIAVVTVAMQVVAVFIVSSGGFLSDCRDPLDETWILRLSSAAFRAQLLRSSCWSLSYWIKYAAPAHSSEPFVSIWTRNA